MNRTSDAETRFWPALIAELLKCCGQRHADNVDWLRFRRRPFRVASATKNMLIDWAARFGFFRAPGYCDEVLAIPGLDRTHELLEDEESRTLFVKLIAYRMMGEQRVRLPLNTPAYWDLRKTLDQYIESRGTITGVPIAGSLDLCNFQGVRFHGVGLCVLNTFLLKQYECPRAGVGVRPGDVVIDGGGCWGDTALYFARDAARVFSFECIPENIEILQKNLQLNAELANRSEVIPRALSGRSGERLRFKINGPGSTSSQDGSGVEVETESIDHFVESRALQQVSLIKMDIEGAETEALKGAEQTIRRFRPQLAISVYHQDTDLVEIPKWIDSLKLDYRFYLDHFTIHREETVLFAVSRPRQESDYPRA
jgi:FkbM family methyltransferase